MSNFPCGINNFTEYATAVWRYDQLCEKVQFNPFEPSQFNILRVARSDESIG